MKHLLAILLIANCAVADVTLPNIFGNNMVLQRESKVYIWGVSDPFEEIEVKGSWCDQAKAAAKADSNGIWQVKIKTSSAGGPYTLKVKANNTIQYDNIMLGDVWICSGQSNMEMPVEGFSFENQPIKNSSQEIRNANHPQIRLFTVANFASSEPVKDCNGHWDVCIPSTAKNFSAVGYFFGRDLFDELKIPIGLIDCTWSATPIEAWMQSTVFQNDSNLTDIIRKNEQNSDDDLSIPSQRKPYRLYNGMVNPIIPYCIKGVIWYQGESNIGQADNYRKLFKALIIDWRNAWELGNFPFIFVQLTNYGKVTEEPTESDWAELRDAQISALALPNTGMAVTIDIGEANNIHPQNKQDVAKRLALWALANCYDKKFVFSGPVFNSMEISQKKIILSFDYAENGLKIKDGNILNGFAISGDGKVFYWANAIIENNKVIVSSEKIDYPVAVRYGWADNPQCSLCNMSGLPAAPFRIDPKN